MLKVVAMDIYHYDTKEKNVCKIELQIFVTYSDFHSQFYHLGKNCGRGMASTSSSLLTSASDESWFSELAEMMELTESSELFESESSTDD